MRLPLLALALTVAGCASVQTLPASDFETETVVEHDLSQDEAYTRLREWASDFYVSAEAAIDYEDREAGTITIKGYEAGPLPPYTAWRYQNKVEVRDGRVRFTQAPAQPMAANQRESIAARFAAEREAALGALADDDDF